jgi:hypothetical protein
LIYVKHFNKKLMTNIFSWGGGGVGGVTYLFGGQLSVTGCDRRREGLKMTDKCVT